MIWDDAIELAKENLEISGFTNRWDEVVDEARKILSEEKSRISREEHKEYLESDEWKRKREKVLIRDNHLCQDCKKIIEDISNDSISSLFLNKVYIIKTLISLLKIFGEDNNIFILAQDVHHLDYKYKQTEKEEEYCVSLCSTCHYMKHNCWTKRDFEYMDKERLDRIIKNYFLKINGLNKYKKELKRIHEEAIKRITIKPEKFTKLNEVKDEKGHN